jgi:uncharacterized protein (TIGR03437 family)
MNPLIWLALSTLAFEPNQGQADPQVRYLARGPGYSLLLTSRDAVLARSGSPLRLRFAGANPAPRTTPLDPLTAYSRYYLGSFHARVPRYGRVRYEQIYPGVDVIYYSRQGELEYDLALAPGADPSRIRLEFDGARRIRLSAAGDLLIETPGGMVRQHRPGIYQDGRPVAGEYALLGKRQVGFRLGSYDRSRPLIIDPILRFATFLGGAEDDSAAGIALDAGGNVYIVGTTSSANFPLFPPNQPRPPGGKEIFVTKLNAAGGGIAFSTYLGGSSDDVAAGAAVDPSGSLYLIGTTNSSNFAGVGGLHGASDALVARVDPAGALVSAAYLGGSGHDTGSAITIDIAGSAYVAGTTNSSDFPTSSGAFRTFSNGQADAFVAKLGGSSGSLSYSTYLGGNDSDQAFGIAVDASGSAYVTGVTNSPNFPVLGAHQATCSPSLTPFTSPCADAFLTRLNPNGTGLLFSTFLGGRGSDLGRVVAVDAAGHAYVAGVTNSTNFPLQGPIQSTFLLGPQDLFISKFSPTGALAYSTYLGGSGDDFPGGIAVDGAGNAWVTGFTSSPNFPTVNPVPGRATCPSPCADVFVTQLNPAGSALVFSTFLGGSGTDRANAIALDTLGAAYVVGETNSPNFPVTTGAFQVNPGGRTDRTDAFLARIGDLNPVPVLTTLSPISIAAGNFGFTLTIFGSNFIPGAIVRWNNDDRPTTFVSGTQVQVEISGGDIQTPGSVQIAVRNPPPGGGASNELSFFIGSATAPAIAAITPTTAAVGDPGVAVGLTGSNFLPSSVVRWNGADRPTTFVNGSRLTVQIPASDLTAPGAAQVSVFNAPPGGGASNAIAFGIVNPVPVLAALSPSTIPAGGPDLTLTVTGSRFLPTTVVRWNGADRSTSFISSTQLRALIPASDLASTGAGQVSLFNPLPAGGSSGVISFPITPAPVVSAGGIVNAASFATQALAAGTIASIFGSNLANATTQAAAIPLPTALGGASVQVDGVNAPLFFVSPFQINFALPWEVQGRSLATITVTSGGVTSSPQAISLVPAAPAMFSTNQRGNGQGAILVAGTGSIAAPLSAFPGSRPARRGEFLEIYAIGLGAVANQPATGAAASANPLSETTTNATVTIGGVSAPVLFAGLAAGFVDLYQINVRVLDVTPIGPAIPIVLSIAGVASNTVTVAVE